MRDLKQNEIVWQQIKLVKNGAKGLKLKYGYLYSHKGHSVHKKYDSETDVPPSDDLIRLIKSLKPIVAKVMGMDYARTVISMPEFEATDLQQQLVEGKVQQAMQSIDVIGVSLSTRKNEEGAIITYSNEDENKQITGHTTAWINFNGAYNYGIEDDLNQIVEELKEEAYKYEVKEKYVDFEQMALEYPEDDDVEEAEEVD